jgi:hypothetical protein
LTALVVLLGGVLFTSSAMAVDLSETVHLHGFVSQAYVSTSDNRYFGPSDSGAGSFEFTELGVNLSWQALSNLQFAAQAGYRKAGDTEEATPRLDYGLADFAFYNGADSRGGIRAGRYRMPLGFYNTTRDVANTRPSIFLPSVYSDSARNLLLSLDGGSVYWESRTAVGDFTLSGGAGKLVLSDDEKNTAKATTSYVGQLLYELDGGRLRLALSGVEAKFDITLQPFRGAELDAKIYLLSAQYNAENWSVTGEFAPDSTTSVSGVPPPLTSFNSTQKPQNYYLQGNYRLAPHWEALLRYDAKYQDKGDKSGTGYAATHPGTPAYSRFAKDWTLGLSWEVRHDTKIRAEWHHVDGTGWLSSKENPKPLNTTENWDLFALQASYNF